MAPFLPRKRAGRHSRLGNEPITAAIQRRTRAIAWRCWITSRVRLRCVDLWNGVRDRAELTPPSVSGAGAKPFGLRPSVHERLRLLDEPRRLTNRKGVS